MVILILRSEDSGMGCGYSLAKAWAAHATPPDSAANDETKDVADGNFIKHCFPTGGRWIFIIHSDG